MTAASLSELWMCGVAANPAAPPDVLLRLLDPAASKAWSALCQHRELPAEVVEAVLAHSDVKVSVAFALNPVADPAQRSRLADDPATRVRCALAAYLPRNQAYRRPLPDDAVWKLLFTENDPAEMFLIQSSILWDLWLSRQIRRGFFEDAAKSPDPGRRLWATDIWTNLPQPYRDALLADPDEEVRHAAKHADRYADPQYTEASLPEGGHHRAVLLANFALSRAVAERCLATGRDLGSLAHNPYTPADIVARLARDPDPRVRERVAARPDIDGALLAELADDPDPRVRTRAILQPLPRTEAQRTAIDEIIKHTADTSSPGFWRAPAAEADWFADCARSEHPLLRRVAAAFGDLSAETVGLMAQDPDLEVRHLLALNQPHAPADLVVQAFIACRRQREYIRTLPWIPRTGMAHLAHHPDPEIRELAAADPTSEEPLEAALADVDVRVRRAAASNPRMEPARLAALLTDPELAEAAAANPRLSAGELRGLLDRAGLPRAVGGS